MRTCFDTYIFDLDGTLLDTLNDLAMSTNFALRSKGMAERTIDEVRRFVGNGVRKLIERAVPQGTSKTLTEETLAVFRQHYLLHSLDTTRPYPGIMSLLEELKKKGKKVAVVSNKFDKATKELCSHFFGGLVDVAIGESETVRKKPAPDTVEEAIRQLHADRDGAVYIGDSEVDIATAANCHIPCISVLWGFRERDFLLAHGATRLVASPLEIGGKDER
ncbi:MAG: HAD family hydrolase [Prevotella sp.]|nr:HAD family hydrolase [Prevotella sp.]